MYVSCNGGESARESRVENTTRRHPRMLPTGSAKTALLPAILGDVNAGGGGAPIERENEGEMDHFVTIENRKRNDSEKGKFVQVENKIQRKMIEAAD